MKRIDAAREGWFRPIALVMSIMLAAASLLLSAPAMAHEGDAHGAPAQSTAGPAQPRLAAESESFELVAVLEGERLVLWLDRWADNTPVRNARIELEVAGHKATAMPAADGSHYEAKLPAPLPEGMHPVTVSVVAGDATDLLAGEIDIHRPGPTAPTAAAAGAGAVSSRLSAALASNAGRVVALAAAIVALAAIAAFIYLRRRARSQRS